MTNWFYRRRRVSFSTRLFRVYSEFNVIPLPLDFQASLSVHLSEISLVQRGREYYIHLYRISFKFSKLLLFLACHSPTDNFSTNYYTQGSKWPSFPSKRDPLALIRPFQKNRRNRPSCASIVLVPEFPGRLTFFFSDFRVAFSNFPQLFLRLAL